MWPTHHHHIASQRWRVLVEHILVALAVQLSIGDDKISVRGDNGLPRETMHGDQKHAGRVDLFVNGSAFCVVK